jgi:hypothetical protein
MRPATLLLPLLLAVLACPLHASAQEAAQWRPPGKAMPAMPTMSELDNNWHTSLGSWFRGIEVVTGSSAPELRATGSARGGSGRAQVARFMRGPVPVVVMTDQNGDGRADKFEIYRGGRTVIQVIDVDYNGEANVLRLYDASGALIREERM